MSIKSLEGIISFRTGDVGMSPAFSNPGLLDMVLIGKARKTIHYADANSGNVDVVMIIYTRVKKNLSGYGLC